MAEKLIRRDIPGVLGPDPQSDGASSITNCMLIPRRDLDAEEYLVVETTHGDGSVFVNLDGYLICPKDMFTEEEIEAASRKYRRAN